MSTDLRVVVLAAFAALGACSSRVEQAEKQYEIVKKVGSAADLCAQGKVVVAAYLQAQDTEKYSERRIATDSDCNLAMANERAGIFKMPDGSEEQVEVDNVAAIAENAAVAAIAATAKPAKDPRNDPGNPCYKAGPRC